MFMSNNESSAKRDIVLIHGLFLTHASWEHWIRRYTDRGYTVHAPGWPGLQRSVA
jgi:alpha-beta hydrolase superfamily lysophospholipase